RENPSQIQCAYSWLSLSTLQFSAAQDCHMLQVKLRQIKIAGLSNFQVRRRAGDHRNRRACAFDNAGLIGSEKTVCHGFREGAFQKAAAEALRRLRLHNVLARDGGSDESAVSRALYLFDGVYSGQAHDGSVMFFN